MPRTASSTMRDRILLADVLGALLAQAAFVSAVIPVELLLFLAAGQPDLGRVDDHDVVARIDVRRVDGLVLALEQARRLGRHPAEHQALGVNDMPLPLHTSGSGNKRTHRNPFRPPRERSGRHATEARAQAVSLSQRTANQEDTGDCGHCQASAPRSSRKRRSGALPPGRAADRTSRRYAASALTDPLERDQNCTIPPAASPMPILPDLPRFCRFSSLHCRGTQLAAKRPRNEGGEHHRKSAGRSIARTAERP